jgi:hypothetical protein
MGLIGKLQQKLVEHAIAGKLKDVAEGKHGPKLKAIYWGAHKYAFDVGLALSAGDLIVSGLAGHGCTQCPGIDHWIQLSAGVLAAGGLSLGFHAAPAPAKGK